MFTLYVRTVVVFSVLTWSTVLAYMYFYLYMQLIYTVGHIRCAHPHLTATLANRKQNNFYNSNHNETKAWKHPARRIPYSDCTAPMPAVSK